MEAILKFNLDDDADAIAFRDAQKGSAQGTILWNFDQWLRSQIKHNNKDEWNEVRTQLHEIAEAEGIDIYAE